MGMPFGDKCARACRPVHVIYIYIYMASSLLFRSKDLEEGEAPGATRTTEKLCPHVCWRGGCLVCNLALCICTLNCCKQVVRAIATHHLYVELLQAICTWNCHKRVVDAIASHHSYLELLQSICTWN